MPASDVFPSALPRHRHRRTRDHVRRIVLRALVAPPDPPRVGSLLVEACPRPPLVAAHIRAVLDLVGVQDCLSKAFGSTNNKNLSKAVLDGLKQLRSREQVQALRKVEIDKTHTEESHEATPSVVVEEVATEKISEEVAK